MTPDNPTLATPDTFEDVAAESPSAENGLINFWKPYGLWAGNTRCGVYRRTEQKVSADISEDGEEHIIIRWSKICGQLDVVGRTYTDDGAGWGYVVRFYDPNNHRHELVLPSTWIVAGRTDDMPNLLAHEGLDIVPGCNTDIRKYIYTVNPDRKIFAAARLGWHGTTDGRVFVLPKQIIGPGADDVILDRRVCPAEVTVRGTLPDWQRGVAALCAGNNFLVFGVSLALAAPSLHLLNEPSKGFHLYGHSSKGKSTALHVGRSVWGHKMETWRTTDNALERTAEQHNDTLLAIDELQQISAKQLEAAVYMLGNEQSKRRMDATSGLQRTSTWRMLFLSSGEKTLAEHVSSGTVNADIKAGVEQRMIQLNAEDAGRGMGVFENIHGCATPADFADLLTKQNTSKYQGVAGPAWAAWLIDHEPDAVRRMDEMISAFKQRVIPVGAAGEIHRAARIFAVVGAAGELATEAGITGWDRGAALSAAEWAFHRWLTTRPSLGASDLDKAIRRLQAYIVEHSDNRFEDLDTPPDPGRPMNDRVGFREVDRTTGELEYFIQTPQLEEIVGGRVDSLVQELNARGYLRTSGDRLQVKKRIAALSKNPMWFYVLREALFHAGEVRSTGAVAAQEVTV